MIYLFRKRNGSIIATEQQSASSMFNTPGNFVTHQPEYLGCVDKLQYKDALRQAEEEVPVEIQKLVKKDGEDTLITLDAEMIHDLIEGGDKKIEAQYGKILKKKQEAVEAALEALTETSDKNSRPTDYSKRLAAVDDVRGSIEHITNGYTQ
jgi:hypothetical protein